MTTFTTEDRVAVQGPRHKDIMVNDFNLRFREVQDGTWICEMPKWLLEVFEQEVEKGRISHD